MVPFSTAPIELVLRFAGMAVMFQVMAIVIFRRQVEASPFRRRFDDDERPGGEVRPRQRDTGPQSVGDGGLGGLRRARRAGFLRVSVLGCCPANEDL